MARIIGSSTNKIILANIEINVKRFYERIVQVDNHRFLSWEHCYHFFTTLGTKPSEEEKDLAALHLSFYLASWGMLRNSFLLWKDYKVNIPIVGMILEHKESLVNIVEYTDKNIKTIMVLKEEIKKYYEDLKPIEEYADKKTKLTKDTKASDTLISKILLGTLGCTPAYDRFFKEGLDDADISFYSSKSLSQKGLEGLGVVIKNHYNEFNSIREYLRKNYNKEYPIMKLVDMYFWYIGYKKENPEESDIK